MTQNKYRSLYPGSIIRAGIPYSDCEKIKTRFPVIVSSEKFNNIHPEVVVAFSTSSKNIHHPQDYDVEISDRHPQFSYTGLTNNTTVRCGRLWTINKDQIYEIIGIVPDDLLIDIVKLTRQVFV
jgi:hypothetical protein